MNQNIVTEIKTKRLILRPVSMEDFESLKKIVTDVETVGKMRDFPIDEDELYSMIEFGSAEYTDDYPFVYSFSIIFEGETVGSISLYINYGENSGEIGYYLAKKHWNKGIMTEAANSILGFAKDYVLLDKITAETDKTNIASWKVMEKLGMKRVGERQEIQGNKSTPYIPRVTVFYELGQSVEN